MKKKPIFLTLFALFVLSVSLLLTSCGKTELEFKDKTVVADGTTQSIEIEGTIPSGYTVEYKNNSGSQAGDYYATAIVKNGNEVVETLYATLTIDNPNHQAFEDYLDQFFIEYLEGDQLSINIICENPENFGLDHYDAVWYTYHGFTQEDQKQAKAQYELLNQELNAFDYAQLSNRQKIAYTQIQSMFEYNMNYYAIDDILYQQILYVDQFGGYVADFGTYLEAYTIRNKQDVEDIISYVTSTGSAFPSYVEFVKDKAEKGYALSDFTIHEMTSYLDDVLNDGENYYLIDVLNTKISSTTVLNDTEKNDAVQRLNTAFKEDYLKGVEALRDGIQDYLGRLSTEGYWASYTNGKQLFELELKDVLGMKNLSMDQYIQELDEAIEETNKRVTSALNQLLRIGKISSYEQLEKFISEHFIFEGTPEEMLEYLKEFAKTIVPDLKTTPSITIKEMDEASAKVSNAVAYYMKSALDNDKQEFITLNPVKLGDANDVLGTLSHEGYPGHLYAYTFTKQLDLHNISKIMTSTAHGEGWATYVELALYQNIINTTKDSALKAIARYLYANQLSGFLLETRIDVGIHYQGWNIARIAYFMDNLGYSSDAAQDIYRLLIETPTSYAAYGYGKLFFYNLHEEAKEILKDQYNEVEFNEMLLSKGWTSLDVLQETYDNYMKKKCHKLGIPY